MSTNTMKTTKTTMTTAATTTTTTMMADAVGGMATTGRGRGEDTMTEQNTTIKEIPGEGGSDLTMTTKTTTTMTMTTTTHRATVVVVVASGEHWQQQWQWLFSAQHNNQQTDDRCRRRWTR